MLAVVTMINAESFVRRHARHMIVITGLTACFTLHNYMQELIMSQPDFKFGAILAFLDVVGVTFFSGVERILRNDKPRIAPWSSYLTLCLFLCMSSSAANAALNYINYPTRVIFRSCKLVPTIVIAALFHRKQFQMFELLLGVTMSLGMVMFALADYQLSAVSSTYGILLVSFSVVADSFLPNYQVEVFSTGASRAEVTFFTNALCLVLMTCSFSASGDLQGSILYAYNDSWMLFLMVIYTLVAYLAVTCHMTLVLELGSVAAVIVGNARKALTIALSFILFPKPFSFFYVLGVILVFGSVILNVVWKEQRNSQRQKQQQQRDLTDYSSVYGKSNKMEYP